jgi:low temperature requirement protein LtrA
MLVSWGTQLHQLKESESEISQITENIGLEHFTVVLSLFLWLMWVSSLVCPNLLGTKRLGCCCCIGLEQNVFSCP